MARQRCVVHGLRKVWPGWPRGNRGRCALHRILYAGSLEEAKAAAGRFMAQFGKGFPTACELLEKHLAACLAFFGFPEVQWKHLRTTNALERAFREVRRRTDVIGRFSNEMAALEVIFGVLEGERLQWRRVRVEPADVAEIGEAVRSLDEEPIWVELGKAASG